MENVFIKPTLNYTFLGKQLPRGVFICGIPFESRTYIMSVTQCYNCFLYGYTHTMQKREKAYKNVE